MDIINTFRGKFLAYRVPEIFISQCYNKPFLLIVTDEIINKEEKENFTGMNMKILKFLAWN